MTYSDVAKSYWKIEFKHSFSFLSRLMYQLMPMLNLPSLQNRSDRIDGNNFFILKSYSYLSRCKALMFYNGYVSGLLSIPSGVFLGLYLGPIFPNIYLNDLLMMIMSRNELVLTGSRQVIGLNYIYFSSLFVY